MAVFFVASLVGALNTHTEGNRSDLIPILTRPSREFCNTENRKKEGFQPFPNWACERGPEASHRGQKDGGQDDCVGSAVRSYCSLTAVLRLQFASGVPSVARPHSTLRSPLLSASGPLDSVHTTLRPPAIAVCFGCTQPSAALLHSCNCSFG